MNNRMACLFSLLMVAATMSPAQGEPILLVDGGKSVATIVVPAEPSDIDWTAADDLREYVRQMTGAELPILAGAVPEQGAAILVGPGQLARRLVGRWLTGEHVGDDGYVLKTFDAAGDRPPTLVVVGRGKGTRYGVFALLRTFGCRFFHPWQDGEHVPSRKDLRLGSLDVVSKPDIIGRRLWGAPYDDQLLSKEQWRKWWRWQAQHGVNNVNVYMSHNYQGFCPKSLYEEHPEYFSLVFPGTKAYEAHASNEAKEAGRPDRIKYTRCLSNPEVVQLAVEAAGRHFARGAGSYSLSPDDVSRYQWCQCKPCRAMDGPGGKVSARILRFNNKVAEALEDKYGDRMLPFYAEYGIPGGPPIHKDGTVMVSAHPMVIPVVVNVYCRLHDIRKGCSWPFAPIVNAWKKVSDRIAIRGYRMWSRYPAPGTWTVGHLVRFYRDSGAMGYVPEILGRSPDNKVALYVIAKMMWDSDQDPNALVEDYFQHYFQEARDAMHAYYRYLNDLVVKQGTRHSDTVFEPVAVKGAPPIYNDKTIAELSRLLAKAEAAARQQVVKRRVHRDRLALTAFDRLRRVEELHLRWGKDKDPKTAAGIETLVEEAMPLLDQLAGRFIVHDEAMKRRLTYWRDSVK